MGFACWKRYITLDKAPREKAKQSQSILYTCDVSKGRLPNSGPYTTDKEISEM